MSENIYQSFSALKISDQPSSSSLQRKDPDRKAVIPPRPEREHPNRMLWFGYCVEYSWIEDYAHRQTNGNYYHPVLWLRRHIGVPILAFALAFDPEDGSVPPELKSGTGKVTIIGLIDDVEHFRAPLQSQLDRLTELIGRPPRWWVAAANY
ncbi:hypothetical protein BV22DRAFT_1200329 [Leucogyrophana mollusca]|uniref:Uncharacterized protein n=2 Tax=Leucogyrophana mollusca TaxID=85980 RepID=A0ACB8AXR9_9AGAM|nr:hypothetical protein BV22DRAFT_1200331 [Leucogyrophana mollusca]KAH7917229.1 hypothetical protein BV22DRAFT_1200329 [Leucogyrophana mollusca]